MSIIDKWTFALPSGYDWDVSKFAKEVQTKAWTKKFQSKLAQYIDRLTSANSDKVQIIGGMLQTAYGVNIGKQIEARLKPEAFEKIKQNLLSL